MTKISNKKLREYCNKYEKTENGFLCVCIAI